MKVRVEHLFLSPGHNYFGRYGKPPGEHEILAREELECVAGRGVKGDRFFDYQEDYKGQITFFDAAVWKQVRERFGLPQLPPSVFRRNVVLAGVDLDELIGRRFRLGGLEFEGSEECRPCFWMDRACAEGVEDFLKGRGGLRARILAGGSLGLGEYELDVLA